MMQRWTVKNILIALVLIVIMIQAIPGDQNTGNEYGANDISTIVPVHEEVKQILHTSCNDCHSNATEYPWYSSIQPVRMWLDHHVEEGKDELNFSEFATYKKKRQLHKLDEIVEMVEEHEMPLSSYTLIHTDAVLSDAQQTTLINWAKQSKIILQDSVEH
jgi:hypothetical protein